MQPQTKKCVCQHKYKFNFKESVFLCVKEIQCPMADGFGPWWEAAKLDELGSDRSRTGSHTPVPLGIIQEEQYVGDGTEEPAPLLPRAAYRDAETITGQCSF